MITKHVDMAKRDEKTRFMVLESVEIRGVEVNIRNRCPDRGGRAFNDVMLDKPVVFRPGEVKTLVISEAEADKLREQNKLEWQLKRQTKRWVEPETWQLTTDPPTSTDDENTAEPTSSEASEMVAAAEPQQQEKPQEQEKGILTDMTVADDDGTPAREGPARVQRVQRVQRKKPRG
jgi:hypothetical protein